MANPSRYRVVDWLGGRILENRELMTLQSILQGTDPNGNTVTYDLDQIFRPGATQNITATVNGLTVSFGPKNSALPMTVFVRGRWEVLQSTDLPSVTLSNTQTQVFLNYQLRIVTSIEDTSLVDSTTGQATANMGELDFTIGATDTSGAALNPATQLEKNTAPIVMFQFTNNGSALTQVLLDNVNPQALATLGVSGLVSLTTATASGVAVSTDDLRMTNARSPLPSSVVDASVRTPNSVSGTNADGSAKYDLTQDPGGISADKVIWQEVTERLSDFLAWIKSQVQSVAASLAGHIGQMLGQANTHPMPTANQVGAAPLSHVGMQLGMSGSHPALVTANSGGFQVNQTAGSGGLSVKDPAYGVIQNGALVSALLHSGDVLSTPLNSLVTVPGGSPINFSGALTGLHDVAQVLTDHVNQNSHANPHGITAADLGAATQSYVNTAVANGITTAENVVEAWVNTLFASSIGVSGYMSFPGGLMIQWGQTANMGGGQSSYQNFNTVNGRIGFPHGCLGVWLSAVQEAGQHTPLANVVQGTVSSSSFKWIIGAGGDIDGSTTCYWFAIGY
jgi:hypothetical protein